MKIFKYFTKDKIVPQNKSELCIAEYVKRRYNISWDKYLQRFEKSYPLDLSCTDFWPNNIEYQGPLELWCAQAWGNDIDQGLLEYHDDIYGEGFIDISNRYVLKKFDHLPVIKYGLYGKVAISFLMKQNFFNTGKCIIAHRRIIDILNQNCPDDFQAIPIKIINVHKKSEPYGVDDFYMINVTRCIRALDIKKTKGEWDDGDIWATSSYRYKKDPWSDSVRCLSPKRDPGYVARPNHRIPDDKDFEIHKNAKLCMLAIDAYTSSILWHPKLAKQIPIDKAYYFRTGEEHL